MATQTIQNLPPAFLTGIGELFSQYFSGTAEGGIESNPFYVDPSSFTGDQFVADQDSMTTDAQALASGLGGYQSYLDNASGIQGNAQNYFNQNMNNFQPFMDSAAGYYDQMGQAAVAGQNAGAGALANAQTQFDLMGQAAAAGQNAGQSYFDQANQLANQAYGQQMGLGQAAIGQAGQNVGMYGQAAQGQLASAQSQQQQALQNVGLLGQAGGVQANMANQAQQQLANNMGQYGALSEAQLGLGQYDMSMLGNQINAMSQMGSQNQAYEQALLDAQQQGLQASAYAPQQNMGFLGQMLGAAYGAPGGTTFQTTPDPSTLQTLLGAGTGILGILGSAGAFGNNNNNSTS